MGRIRQFLLLMASCSACSSVCAEVLISEVMAKNATGIVTRRGGRELDWIELANTGEEDVDVSGWYLSGNRGKAKKKWNVVEGHAVVPAGGFLVVWADKEYDQFASDEAYVRMGISTSGEELFLAPPETETITDEMVFAFGQQIKDVSFGRVADGGCAYFKEPTPGGANATAGYGPPTPTVTISESHGFKTKPIEVSLSCDDEAKIYYTTDGREPTSEIGILYEGTPIRIDRTTLLRASAPIPNSVLPTVATATYLFVDDILQQRDTPGGGFPTAKQVNDQKLEFGFNAQVVSNHWEEVAFSLTNSIPVYSIVGDPENLFGAKTGIYVNPGGEGRDWERKMSVELFDPLGREPGFQIDCGLRLRGAFSRSGDVPKHAFRLFFRSEYGAGKLEYPLFGDEGVCKFNKLDLRTEQNASWATDNSANCDFIHEVFCRDVQRDQGQPHTRSRYCHLFLNGQYWGLYQTQERDDADFAADYLGGSAEDWDWIKTTVAGAATRYTTIAEEGSMAAFDQLVAFCNRRMSDSVYCQMMGEDIYGLSVSTYKVYLNDDNLIDFMIGLYYEHDPDGPYCIWNGFPNNLHSLYNREARDGFVWLRHDAEHSMNVSNMSRLYNPAYYSCLRWGDVKGQVTRAQMTPTVLHCRLADGSPRYRRKFADRLHRQCFVESGVLSVSNSLARYRARMEEVDGAIWAEAARWGRGLFDKQTWSNACANCMNNFIAKRNAQLLRYYQAEGWYPKILPPQVEIKRPCVCGDRVTLRAAEGLWIYWTDGDGDPADCPSARCVRSNVTEYSVGETTANLKLRAYDPVSGAWSIMATAEVAVEAMTDEMRRELFLPFTLAADPWVKEKITTRADVEDFMGWIRRNGMTLEEVLKQENAYFSFALDLPGVIEASALEELSRQKLKIIGIRQSAYCRAGVEVELEVEGLRIGCEAKERPLKNVFLIEGGVGPMAFAAKNVMVVAVKPNVGGRCLVTVASAVPSSTLLLRCSLSLPYRIGAVEVEGEM